MLRICVLIGSLMLTIPCATSQEELTLFVGQIEYWPPSEYTMTSGKSSHSPGVINQSLAVKNNSSVQFRTIKVDAVSLVKAN